MAVARMICSFEIVDLSAAQDGLQRSESGDVAGSGQLEAEGGLRVRRCSKPGFIPAAGWR